MPYPRPLEAPCDTGILLRDTPRRRRYNLCKARVAGSKKERRRFSLCSGKSKGKFTRPYCLRLSLTVCVALVPLGLTATIISSHKVPNLNVAIRSPSTLFGYTFRKLWKREMVPRRPAVTDHFHETYWGLSSQAPRSTLSPTTSCRHLMRRRCEILDTAKTDCPMSTCPKPSLRM